MSFDFHGVQQSAEPKAQASGDWTKVASVALAAATLIITAFRDSGAVPWLKYAGWPAVGVAALFLIFMAWKFLVAPWRKNRALLLHARTKIADLPDFIRRFKQDVVSTNHTNSISYQIQQLRLQPDDPSEKKPDAHKQAYYINQVLDQLLVRLETPVKGLVDIQLIFAVFDDFIRYVHDLYRDEWRKYLVDKKARIHESTWTQCIKAREAYAKFVDDYRVFRKKQEKDADAIGSGYYYETPDPLG
jgi:hypothetical protein